MMTQDDSTVVMSELLIGGLIAFSAYALWIRPMLRFEQDLLVVVNPFTKTKIPYDDILNLDTKWALKITHKRGVTTAWVAPASGKRRWIADETFKTYGSSVPLAKDATSGTEASSSSMMSLSGQAAYTIREILKRRH